jgi:ribosomal protein S11
VTLANSLGKNLITISSGALGFKGTTKLTSYAIEKVGLFVSKFMKKRRYKNLYIIFNSGAVGYRSKLLIETLIYNSIIIRYLTVSDSVPHNGVRPRKTKRR